jgi:tRNA-splicing ligase RtcB
VQLLSAGIDENPHAYKDINEVMAQQRDLVDVVARFRSEDRPHGGRGERPED